MKASVEERELVQLDDDFFNVPDYPTTPKYNLGNGAYRTLPTPQDE